MKGKDILSPQNVTTAGLVAAIAIGMRILPNIPGSVQISVLAMYGGGAAIAGGVYKVRDIIKDGTSKETKFGDGAFAALGILMLGTAINIGPELVRSMSKELDVNEGAIIILGAIVCGIAFLQARSSILKEIAADNVSGQQSEYKGR